MTLNLTDQHYRIDYRDEFDLRDSLAEFARRCGWEVETEHHIQGWGRPDLYLSAGYTRVAVELKTVLDTPSKCRKAIQQADSYRKAMPEVSWVILAAAHINENAMVDYMSVYDQVDVRHAHELMDLLLGHALTLNVRHREALARHRELERSLEMNRRVLERLSVHESSPLKAWAPAPPHAQQIDAFA